MDKWTSIEKGVIVYICFLKGATEQDLPKLGSFSNFLMNLVSMVLNASICWNEHWKKNSPVVEILGDILIIPQASLVAKPKGKQMQ